MVGRSDGEMVLQVTARREGFRRAGRAWSTAAREVAVAALTADEIQQLRADPMLIVSEIEIAPPAETQPLPAADEGGGAGGPGSEYDAPRANTAGAADPGPGAGTGPDKDTPESEPMTGGGDAPAGAGSAAGRRQARAPGSKSGAGKAKA